MSVSNLVNSLGQDRWLPTAAAFLSTALSLVVSFVLQRYFVSGPTAGRGEGVAVRIQVKQKFSPAPGASSSVRAETYEISASSR